MCFTVMAQEKQTCVFLLGCCCVFARSICTWGISRTGKITEVLPQSAALERRICKRGQQSCPHPASRITSKTSFPIDRHTIKFLHEEIFNHSSSHPVHAMSQHWTGWGLTRETWTTCTLFPILCALQQKFPPEILCFGNCYWKGSTEVEPFTGLN